MLLENLKSLLIGNVILIKYDEKEDDYDTLYETTQFEIEAEADRIPKELLKMEVENIGGTAYEDYPEGVVSILLK